MRMRMGTMCAESPLSLATRLPEWPVGRTARLPQAPQQVRTWRRSEVRTLRWFRPKVLKQVRSGRWLRNVPRRLQTLEDSLCDEGGGGTRGRSTIGAPLASRPWVPYPRFPYHFSSSSRRRLNTSTKARETAFVNSSGPRPCEPNKVARDRHFQAP